MKFKLGSSKINALNGKIYESSVSIKRETPKAILLKIAKRGSDREIWLPKSQLIITSASVEVPDWLYEKAIQ